MQKIVVFDFDKTLTYRDTNFSFFRYIGKQQSFYYIRLLVYVGFVVLRKLRFISNLKLKNLGLHLFFWGLTSDTVLSLSKEFAKTIRLNNSVVKLLNEYVDSNNRVLIVSASISLYITPIFPNIEVIGSLLSFDEKLAKLSNHCYKQEKINRLMDIGVNHIDVLFTDSISDLPLAKISDIINLVKKDSIIECDSLDDFRSILNK